MVTKQDVAILFAGGVTAGVIDGTMEMVWASNPQKWSGKFPFIGTVPLLPPVDDWIVLAVPTIIAGVGHLARKSKVGLAVRTFGIGGIIYAVPMLIHHIILRAQHESGVKFASYGRYATVPIAPIKEI